ncbi:MAG: cytochrome C [Bacteriovorax sp.]|nr:cytochrome C [Bacteriovorax sp.]
MLKELINHLAEPIVSFPIATFLFYLMIKYYKTFGTKKFAVWFTILSIPVLIFFFADPNFYLIIKTPDNVPIGILLIMVAFFTWFTLHKAAINDTRMEQGLEPVEAMPENREKVWSWPNLVYTELFAIIACTAFLVVWAIVFKAPLEESANPTWAPNPAKAPWYFLGLQEMLVYFDPWMAGVVLPGLIVAGLIAVPYIDTNPKGNGYFCFKDRKWAIIAYMYGWLVLWIYLIIVGVFLRGPNWTFYGPFEYWDFHKIVAEFNINLSEFIWIKGLGIGMPKNLVVREIFGIILTIAYVGFIPVWVARATSFGRKFFIDLGPIRYYLFMTLVVVMMSLPIKMVLRWLFSLKYIIALPEWELNL